MPVPSAISDLSTTPASNSPAGSETPSSTDDYLRTAFAFIRQVYNNTPAGNIAATTVQDAINELDAEKVATTAVIAIAQGGTGSTTAPAARASLGVAWELIGSATASSSATVDFTGINGSLYSSFMVELNEIASGTNAVGFLCRVSTGAGFLASGYRHGTFRWTDISTGVAGSSGADTQFILSTSSETHGTASNQRVSYMLTIHGADSGIPTKRATWAGAGLFSSGAYVSLTGGGEVDTNSAPIDGIRFFMSSGVILSGTIRLYGLKNT